MIFSFPCRDGFFSRQHECWFLVRLLQSVERRMGERSRILTTVSSKRRRNERYSLTRIEMTKFRRGVSATLPRCAAETNAPAVRRNTKHAQSDWDRGRSPATRRRCGVLRRYRDVLARPAVTTPNDLRQELSGDAAVGSLYDVCLGGGLAAFGCTVTSRSQRSRFGS